MASITSPGARLRATWSSLQGKPGGRRLFAWMVGRMARYTGSIHPIVQELRPGYARIAMRDRAAVRNHLRSIHAIALMNLAEVTTGLALTMAMPDDARGIIVRLGMEYVKKARGTITAECSAGVVDARASHEQVAEAVLRDAAGDVVARGTAHWLVGPARASAEAAAPAAAAR